jgi:hypothetical protein
MGMNVSKIGIKIVRQHERTHTQYNSRVQTEPGQNGCVFNHHNLIIGDLNLTRFGVMPSTYSRNMRGDERVKDRCKGINTIMIMYYKLGKESGHGIGNIGKVSS